MIPKKIHYIFGLDPEWIKKPLAAFHYFNLLSARKVNPEYTITVHYYHEPTGMIWDRIRDTFDTSRLHFFPKYLNDKPFSYTEHIGDYLRLLLLRQHGGIYLDIDVLCIKPFDDLLDNEFVMGIEKSNAQIEGLCNAVMLSSVESDFSKMLIKDYETNYQPEHWNYNSVVRPYELSQQHPDKIRIMPPDAFFPISWDEIDRRKIFEEYHDLSTSYCLHLWESKHYSELSKYNNYYIRNRKDTLSKLYVDIVLH